MTKRISLSKTAGAVYRAVDALDASVDFDPSLRELVRLRASQLNGCSYCVDYPASDAQTAGESDRRIAAVAAWRGNPLFDDRERAAFALTDAITQLPLAGVPDDVYAEAARHFDDAELGNLVGAIIAINAWNMVGVATGLKPEVEAAAPASA
jgi:AhpD family alkylhydroperoxidase